MQLKIINKKVFWAKIAMLAIFTLAYLPLAEIKHSAPWQMYLGVLIAIHVYFFAVLFSKVSWRTLKESKSKLLVRIGLVTLLSVALIALGKSPIRQEVVIFLASSFALHVLLVSSLHLKLSLSKSRSNLKVAHHKSPVKS